MVGRARPNPIIPNPDRAPSNFRLGGAFDFFPQITLDNPPYNITKDKMKKIRAGLSTYNSSASRDLPGRLRM